MIDTDNLCDLWGADMGASNSHLFSEAKNINVDCLAQCEAVNMFSAKLIPFLASLLHVKGDCLAGSCEKTFLDVYQDVWRLRVCWSCISQFCHVKPNSVPHLVHTGLSVFVVQPKGEKRWKILRVEWRKSFYQQKLSQTVPRVKLLHTAKEIRSKGKELFFRTRSSVEQKYICLLRLLLSVQECIHFTHWLEKEKKTGENFSFR